jgi:hypothetical protein
MTHPWDRIKASGKEESRPPLVGKTKKRRLPKTTPPAQDEGIFVLELGIDPRIVYTRPARGLETKAVYSKNDPDSPDVYTTISYFIYPYQQWHDGKQIRTGLCSCQGFRTHFNCKHLTAAQEKAEPYRQQLENNTILPNPYYQE